MLVPLVVLLSSSVSARGLLVYAAYLLFGLLAPGLLVSRAVLGRSPLLVADLALGAAVGLVLQLAAWFVYVGLGLQGWIRSWPLIVFAVFALVPALRQHWRRGYAERIRPGMAWVLSLSTALVSVWFTALFATTEPMTGRHEWPVDMYWHLGLVELFKRQLRPEDSQVAGSHLGYHWFSHADMATASLMTGIDPATIISRLWVLPLVAVTVGLLLAVALELGRHAQPIAALAALLLAARAGLEVAPWVDAPWPNTFAVVSPSQNYSYPILLLTVMLVVRFLRRGGIREVLPLAALLLLGPGAKSTILPVVVSGLLLATAVSVVLSAPWRRQALLAGMGVSALVLGTRAIGAGGAAGSGLQLLSTLRHNPAYYEYIGLSPTEVRATGGLVLPGLAVPGAGLIAGLLLLATALKYVWLLPGAAALWSRRRAVDPAAWFLFGGGLSGWLLMLLVDQSGLSQVYFLSTGVVLWFLLAAWGLVELWHRAWARREDRAPAKVVLGSSSAALVLVLLLAAAFAGRPEREGIAAALAAALIPLTIALVCIAAVALVRARSGRLHTALGLGAGVMAASVATTLVPTALPPPAQPPGPAAISPAETSAARWLAEHAGPHDVVATNVHCLSRGPGAPCDARGFWVSALTRRRAFIGGWGYLEQTQASDARKGRPQVEQPFHDREELGLNQQLFTDPRPDTVTELRRRGVDWAFADSRRGETSDRLADVARLVYSTTDVDVYRLD